MAWRVRLAVLTAGIAGLAGLLVLAACSASGQLGSQARLEGASAFVLVPLKQGHLPTEAEFAAHQVQRRFTDGWNRPIVYRRWVAADGKEHWALLAYGRDGKPDCADLDCYLRLPTREITGDYNADIVLLDGTFVQFTGK